MALHVPGAGKTPSSDIPSRIGRYEVLGKLDAGGMATVYLAQAVGPAGIEKLVAIKCVHAHLATERASVEMFLDEARIASKCDHPNVCQVFEVGEDAGRHYLAMEYLHGEPLSSVIEALYRKPHVRASEQFVSFAARIVAEASEGLHAAHELTDKQGQPLHVVHRDANPRNIFLTYDGHVKVVDFGVARAVGKIHQTDSNVAVGKVAYMSPEQLSTQPVDRRTDVWSLGVTLWELLSCERLFARDSPAQSMYAIVREPVPWPQCADVPLGHALGRIVMRALERDPVRRFGTARLFARELNAFVAGRGQHVGAPELAAVMEELFDQRKTEKTALVNAATAGRPIGSIGPHADGPTTGLVRRAARSTAVLPSAARRWLRVGWALAALAALASWVVAPVGIVEPRTDPPDDLPPAARPPGRVIGAPARTLPDSDLTTSVPRLAPVPPTSQARPAGAPPVGERPGAGRRPRPALRSAVSITTPGGWAEIRIGGRNLGRTPLRVALPHGRHRVVLEPFGQGTPISRIVRVPHRTRLVIPLTP